MLKTGREEENIVLGLSEVSTLSPENAQPLRLPFAVSLLLEVSMEIATYRPMAVGSEFDNGSLFAGMGQNDKGTL